MEGSPALSRFRFELKKIAVVSCVISLGSLAISLPCRGAQNGPSEVREAAEARRQLQLIDYRHYRDLDDYLSRCERVRVLIPQVEAFYKWSDNELEHLRIKDSGNPHLLKLADFIVSLNAQDKAGLRVLRNEMKLATEMSNLPSMKRQAFFDQKILPLERKEDEISKREVEMVRQAKKQGMALPQWLNENLAEAR